MFGTEKELRKIRVLLEKIQGKCSEDDIKFLKMKVNDMGKHIENLIVVIDGGVGSDRRRSVSRKPTLGPLVEQAKCLDPYYKPCPNNPQLCVHKQLDSEYSKKVCDNIVPQENNTVYMEKTAKMRTTPVSRYIVSIDNFPVAHSDNMQTDSILEQDYLDTEIPLMSINNLRWLSNQQTADLYKKYGGKTEANIAISEGKEDIVSLRKGAKVVM